MPLGHRLRVLYRLIFLALWLPLMIAIITPFWLLRAETMRRFLAQLTFKGVNAMFGIRIHKKGDLSAYRPLMVVSNHCSYLDVLVLGSSLPIAFTPKREIASWPVIGFCCKLAGCVFVERTPKAIENAKSHITRCLRKGRVMCIFPEGTTNDGNQLLPFRSSLFSVAELLPLEIQPISLHYTHINGVALDEAGRSHLAWFGNTALMPHLMQVLGLARIDVTLKLHGNLKPADYTSRKALCEASETIIRAALAEPKETI